MLGNSEISVKCLNFIKGYPISQSPWQNENSVNSVKKVFKNRN